MAVDTNVSQLIINKMSAEQYKEAKESGTLSSTELYFVKEDADVEGGGGSVEDDGVGEKWELLADVTIEESTQNIISTWYDTPMKRIKVAIATPAASANTNYMPATIYTGANSGWWNSRFYPRALPLTSAAKMIYDISAIEINGLNIIEFVEYSGDMETTKTVKGLGEVRKNISAGNNIYSDVNPTKTITGFEIMSYAVFDVGTTLKIWGVRA